MENTQPFIKKWTNFDWRDVRVHLIYEKTVEEMRQDLKNLIDSKWIKCSDKLPKESDVVVDGYSKKWIDLDFNPQGIRECFIGGEGEWFSARYSASADEWITEIGETPTHWKHRQPPKEK